MIILYYHKWSHVAKQFDRHEGNTQSTYESEPTSLNLPHTNLKLIPRVQQS